MQWQKKLNTLLQNEHFKQTSVYQSLLKSKLGFIDVGARGGVHDYVLPVASCTSVVGFEPDTTECKRMQENHSASVWGELHLLPYALGEYSEKQKLHLLSADTNHSLRPPNTILINRYNMQKNWTLLGTEELETVRLDDVLKKELPYFFADFIKLDTQGTEYEILKGAPNVLTEQVTSIVCEVSFCHLYEGQKLFSEVEMLLREHQFSFYGFMPIHTRSKKMLDKKEQVTAERALYADALFFKDPLSVPGVKLNERQIYSLFTVAFLMGYYDYALELAAETWLRHASEMEKNHVHALIKEVSYINPKQTQEAVRSLLKSVEEDPDRANVLVGSFVDKRRRFCDYDDVLNVRPLPVSYD